MLDRKVNNLKMNRKLMKFSIRSKFSETLAYLFEFMFEGIDRKQTFHFQLFKIFNIIKMLFLYIFY